MVECESDKIRNALSGGIRFNRYMVECELRWVFYKKVVIIVLIDTWWNVNVFAAGQAGEWEDSFNRYMVECES